MNKYVAFIYGIVCYVIFLVTFLYAVGFVGNILVPKSIDGTPQASFGLALVINTVLLGIFAVQHSVMARPAFKQWWTNIVPEPIERSTYVLFSSVALIVLFAFWEPLGGVVWQVENDFLSMVLLGGFAFGWGLVLVATFLINHFDLFGLRQVWLYLREKPYTNLPFGTPGPYKLVRHPLYVGWFFAFWCAPTMTVTHLVFAMATTAYILIAIQFEERDLVTFLGEDYENYRRSVPMIIPFTKSKKPGAKVA